MMQLTSFCDEKVVKEILGWKKKAFSLLVVVNEILGWKKKTFFLLVVEILG